MMTSHASLVRALELRLDWDDAINSIMVPSSRKELTKDTAEWFVEKGHTINRRDEHYIKALNISNEYLIISNKRYYL